MTRKQQLRAFGVALRTARSAAGLTQQQLAAEVGVNQSTVAGWENGLTGASEDRVVALERVLAVAPGELGWYLGFGLPPAVGSAIAAIQADPDLSDEAKDILLSAYEAARRANAGDDG